jgi:hypothetical protein
VLMCAMQLVFYPLGSRAANLAWCVMYWLPAATVDYIQGGFTSFLPAHPLTVYIPITAALIVGSLLFARLANAPRR